jgi:hypothetical protein
MRKILLVLVLALLSRVADAQVVIYADCNYTGQASILGPGNYYNPFQYHITDNALSSLRVPAGFRVELYDNINMFGAPYVVRGNVSCLPASFNNRVSSIRITYSNANAWEGINSEGGVSLFTGCQYTGRFAFLPPGNYPSLRSVIGNDAISSFRIPQGMVIELFRDEQFRGPTTGPVTANSQCLTGYWNNQVSSVRVYYQENGGWLPPPPPPWQGDGLIRAFSGCSYRGQTISLREGIYTDLRGQLNNMPLAALQVGPGMEVELYSGPNLTGSIMGRFTANQSCLSPDIQFKARSARISSVGVGGGNWDGKGIVFFSDCGYRGRSRTLAPGRYSNLNNANAGINPASFRVAPGYVLELFTEPNFQGASTGRMTENEDCLGDYWRNRARSAIITYSPGIGGNFEDVIVYRDCYFRGQSQVIRPGYYNNMSTFGSTTLNPSSLRVPPGYRLELFQQDNFNGSRLVVTGDDACISSTWRGRVRSMIVTYNGFGGGDPWSPGNTTVTVYQGCYFNGKNVSLREGRFESMGRIGLSNGNMASLKVPMGYEVELYQYQGFSGNRIVVRGDNTCLSSTFRNRVGSIIVRRMPGFMPREGVQAREGEQTKEQEP